MSSACVRGVCVCVWGCERRARATGSADGLRCERRGSEELVVRWWWDRRSWEGFPPPRLPGRTDAEIF